MNGNEILLKSVFKMLNIDGEKIEAFAKNIGNNIVEAKAQMDRIEAKQDVILTLLSARGMADLPAIEHWPVANGEMKNG